VDIDGELPAQLERRLDVRLGLGADVAFVSEPDDGDTQDVRLFGGPGEDRLVGGRGDDRFDGGRGRDVIRGGPGDDTFRARDGEPDRIDGGPGIDSGRFDAADRVRGVERRD
jgi:Ca2+-binding RTX toxin-like protein